MDSDQVGFEPTIGEMPMRIFILICFAVALAGTFFFSTVHTDQTNSLASLDNDLYLTGIASTGDNLAEEVPDYIGMITPDSVQSVDAMYHRTFLYSVTFKNLDSVSKEGAFPVDIVGYYGGNSYFLQIIAVQAHMEWAPLINQFALGNIST